MRCVAVGAQVLHDGSRFGSEPLLYLSTEEETRVELWLEYFSFQVFFCIREMQNLLSYSLCDSSVGFVSLKK